MPDRYIGERRRRSPLILILVALLLLLICSRYIASTLIDYAWWSELKQTETWVNLLLYGTGPLVILSVIFFVAFFLALRVGLKRTGDMPIMGVLSRRLIVRLGALLLGFVAVIAANATVDSWTVVRYFGGLRVSPSTHEYSDPIFHKPLQFYFFSLPFYSTMLHVVLVGTVVTLLIYWVAAHGQDFLRRLPSGYGTAGSFEFEPPNLREAFDSRFVRSVVALFLAALAVKYYLNRYDLLLQDHGSYLVGVDWVAEHLVLPLQWLMILGAMLAAVLVLARKGRFALLLLLILPVRYVLPSLVAGLYVRPNELALERPYIDHHIAATRSAYGLNQRVTETHLEAVPEIAIDYAKHKSLLDNVRLWDWRAFHDTVSQIQPLRPYSYMDTDVDRYNIDGQLRQVLVAPRELDIRQLGDARNRWINPHLIYTHGYGLVMAEANRITPDGLPVLFIKNAPIEVTTRSLRVTKPEIYYGEIAHEPVFVDTGQQEFNFPSGAESVYTRYTGGGGFPASLLNRLAAALHYGDINILLTSYLSDRSRMMIRRPILERLSKLAGFLIWDSDPYMIVTSDGHLVWIADGYMSSDVHPYSRALELPNGQTANYIRNSIKATVDAYTGETNLYIFDPNDVLIQAYSKLFPELFKPLSAMPPDVRAHARYPETLFSAQAEIYRTFHMRDAESFYNRADLWDLARVGNRSSSDGASTASPTYVVATLPGEDQPEFLLITPFTPANKDNLIGFMSARCDGEHLGELVFQQLSKQNIIYGPMQIDARVNQDQTISKDLSLWNQQGSQVLRGQTLVLPIENSFLYVEPIYIQASQASMPQLKKVALAMGNRLAYADTYEQALTQLIDEVGSDEGVQASTPATPAPNARTTAIPQPATANPVSLEAVQKLQSIRDHLQKYRELTAAGRSADAGKELDEIQKLLAK
ncbi:MAG: UPF0182 family protein [Acidobacteriaceae bacterium]|nr:UPF0182 family protein [Acidobacteriaceae bacterium]